MQEDAVEATDSTSAEGSLVTAVWRLELTRARHVLRAYLRTRRAPAAHHALTSWSMRPSVARGRAGGQPPMCIWQPSACHIKEVSAFDWLVELYMGWRHSKRGA